jgi:tripartite-type tricarboxylate transporter receptor subunit TctC
MGVAVCGLGLAIATAPTTAQNYPSKAIKIIVAAAAGGPTDVPARLAAQILSPKLGQPVVVENRPGAAGAIGAREAARAKPDGHTLLMGNTSTLAVIPAVSATAGYDPVPARCSCCAPERSSPAFPTAPAASRTPRC